MSVGFILVCIAVVMFVSTLKTPTWLGGPVRRYTSDDTTNAALQRASRRSLAMYLAGAGAIFWSTKLEIFGL